MKAHSCRGIRSASPSVCLHRYLTSMCLPPYLCAIMSVCTTSMCPYVRVLVRVCLHRCVP